MDDTKWLAMKCDSLHEAPTSISLCGFKHLKNLGSFSDNYFEIPADLNVGLTGSNYDNAVPSAMVGSQYWALDFAIFFLDLLEGVAVGFCLRVHFPVFYGCQNGSVRNVCVLTCTVGSDGPAFEDILAQPAASGRLRCGCDRPDHRNQCGGLSSLISDR